MTKRNRFGALIDAQKTENARPDLQDMMRSEEQTAIVRDGFTFPKNDHDLLKAIDVRCARLGVKTNKSEVVRAGLRVLWDLDDGSLKLAIESLDRLKKGAPKRKV